MSMKINVDFNEIDALADLIGDIDSTCSPVLDERTPEDKFKAIQALAAQAHQAIERMLGQYADLVYVPESLQPESVQVAA